MIINPLGRQLVDKSLPVLSNCMMSRPVADNELALFVSMRDERTDSLTIVVFLVFTSSLISSTTQLYFHRL